MTVDGLVTQMRADPDCAGAFSGTGSQGGGAPPTDGGALNVGGSGSEILPTHRGQMTPRQKVDFIRDNGNESYQSLPW